MATQTLYRTSRRNNATGANIFGKAKQTKVKREISEDKRDNVIDWVTFYRKNVHRFVEHYFGIELYPYQIIWLYLMSQKNTYVSICSRATGKSWLLGVYAMAVAVLYPNSEIVIVSSTKEQAGIIIDDKIKSLQSNHPNLAREIKKLTSNMNNWLVELHNGSQIKVVAPRDSSRGHRSTFTIYDEFRLIKKDVVDSVIRPFGYIRQTPYLKKAEYKHLRIPFREAFISSAYHKNEWWYDETKSAIKNMLKGKSSGFIAIDYLAAVKHGIKTLEQIEDEKSKMGEVVAKMEYDNIPWGESADAYFTLDMFSRARKIKRAFYPQRTKTFNPRKNPYQLQRVGGEIRIVTCDIATMPGESNDLSVTGCLRLLPTNKGYIRELVYMESYSGTNSIKQGVRIKQLFKDFDGDYVVLDMLNAGPLVYDQLGLLTEDPERGDKYSPMTIMYHPTIDQAKYEYLLERTSGLNALPVIYPIFATGALNTQIAVSMRDKLQKRMFGLLADEKSAEHYLTRSSYKKEFISNNDINANAFFMAPYVQTTFFVNECINLSMGMLSGNIKLTEPSGSRKDRYTSIAYGNYFATLLDQELIKKGEPNNMWEQMMALTQSV